MVLQHFGILQFYPCPKIPPPHQIINTHRFYRSSLKRSIPASAFLSCFFFLQISIQRQNMKCTLQVFHRLPQFIISTVRFCICKCAQIKSVIMACHVRPSVLSSICSYVRSLQSWNRPGPNLEEGP